MIKELPEETILQIAAGEVVERPANVVKELVENSIDAGATTVDIVVDGVSFIEVKDDGCGISKDDLILTIRPHATSKITDIKDLNQLQTYGFRGEALSAISSVSRLTIFSRKKDAHGWRLYSEPGKEPVLEPYGGPKGTIVTVQDLFFNQPVRQKFLKSVRSEQQELKKWVERMALGSNNVTFRLRVDGRKTLELYRSDRLTRSAEVLGVDSGRILTCRIEGPDFFAEIFCSDRDFFVRDRRKIFIFVNRRWIRSSTLLHALISGIPGLEGRDLFPRCVLFIETKPENFDVNVHPQKTEIRFKNEKQIYRYVHDLAALTFRRDLKIEYKLDNNKIGYIKDDNILKNKTSNYTSEKRGIEVDNIFSCSESLDVVTEDKRFNFLGHIFDTYLLFLSDEGLFIIDQHAVSEKITYEKLKRDFEDNRLGSQSILFPLMLEIEYLDEELRARLEKELLRFGFDIHFLDETRVVVNAAPVLVDINDIEQVIHELLEIIEKSDKTKVPQLVDSILKSLACHNSLKGNVSLLQREAEELLRGMTNLDEPGRCPHGRPTYVILKRKDFEKLFGRDK